MGNVSCCGTDNKEAIYKKIAELKRNKQRQDMKPKLLIDNNTRENWIEDEKNVNTDRVHRLSFICSNKEQDVIRENINRTYDYDTDTENYSSESESNLSELSAASRQEITQFARQSHTQLLKLGKTNPPKSNLTPTSANEWDHNELEKMKHEYEQQIQHMNNIVNDSRCTNKKRTKSLFRVQSIDKWNKHDVDHTFSAMKEQFVHLLHTNSQNIQIMEVNKSTDTECSKSTRAPSTSFHYDLENNIDAMALHTNNVNSDDSNDSHLTNIEDANVDEYLSEKQQDVTQFIGTSAVDTVVQNYNYDGYEKKKNYNSNNNSTDMH